jgi:hypothetical protein
VLGPWGLRAIPDAEGVMHIAEFGVVLLLFVIGLELQPSRLRAMRKAVFGLGLAQVLARRRRSSWRCWIALGMPANTAAGDCIRACRCRRHRSYCNCWQSASSSIRTTALQLRSPAFPGHRRDADAGHPAACSAAATGILSTDVAERARKGLAVLAAAGFRRQDTCCDRCCAVVAETKSVRRSPLRR